MRNYENRNEIGRKEEKSKKKGEMNKDRMKQRERKVVAKTVQARRQWKMEGVKVVIKKILSNVQIRKKHSE